MGKFQKGDKIWCMLLLLRSTPSQPLPSPDPPPNSPTLPVTPLQPTYWHRQKSLEPLLCAVTLPVCSRGPEVQGGGPGFALP